MNILEQWFKNNDVFQGMVFFRSGAQPLPLNLTKEQYELSMDTHGGLLEIAIPVAAGPGQKPVEGRAFIDPSFIAMAILASDEPKVQPANLSDLKAVDEMLKRRV